MQRVLVVVALGCSAHEPPARIGPAPTPAPAPTKPAPILPAAPPPHAPGLRLPDGVTPLAYDLRLDLDPDQGAFHGTVAITVRIDAPTDRIWIHEDELEVASARYRDGTRVAELAPLGIPGDQMIGFGFGETIDHRTIELDFDYVGHTGHDEQGLFRQRHHDHWYMFSQGEAVFARRIVPCFDEPRFKTPWTVTLVIPAALRGFSNMPAAHEQDLGDGHREISFAATAPIASYLVAVAVGPFEVVDAGVVGKQRIPLRVIALEGARARVGVVASRVPAIVDALERYTGEPLPWPKLDIVTVPHLFGAMENPGLITFDAPVVIGDPKHRGFAGYFARIAAHELAHQWFGNLVTPAWWNDLWLSEAIASWLGERVVAQDGGEQLQLHRALTREHAFEADAEPGVRALRHPVERNEDADTAFPYEKGETMLAGFEAWIGVEPVRAALRSYLRDHRNGVVTTADLLAELAAVSTPAAAAALGTCVDHAGVPVVELALECGDAAPKLVAHARDGVVLPMCVRYGGVRGPDRVCGLVGERTELALATCPKWIVAASVDYDQVVWTSGGARGPAPPLARFAPFERIALGNDLAGATERGDVSIHDALAELGDLAGSRDVFGEYAAIAIARAIDPIVDPATRGAWASWLAARFARRLEPAAWFGAARGALDARIRDELARMVGDHAPAATIDRARKRIAAALARHVVPDQLAIAVAGGDAAAFERVVELAHATDADLRDAAFDALGGFGPDAAALVVSRMPNDLPTREALSIIGDYFERGATRAAMWTAIRNQLPRLLAFVRGVEAAELLGDTATLCDPIARAEVAAAFGPNLATIADGRLKLAHTLDTIDRCIARRRRATDLPGTVSKL